MASGVQPRSDLSRADAHLGTGIERLRQEWGKRPTTIPLYVVVSTWHDPNIWWYTAPDVFDLIPSLLSLTLAAVALVIAVRAFLLSRSSVPNQVIEALGDLKARVLNAEENLAAHDARALQWRTEIDGLIESAEDVLDRVEKKRRRIAGAEARAKQANGEPDGPQTDGDLWRRARELGYANQ